MCLTRPVPVSFRLFSLFFLSYSRYPKMTLGRFRTRVRTAMPTIDFESPSSKTRYTVSPASQAHSPLPEPVAVVLLQCWDDHEWQSSSDAIADWVNARWKKSGYSVSRETVCFTLRLHGRDARMGLGDDLCGAFVRTEVSSLE